MTRTSFIKLIKILATSIVALLIIAFVIWRSFNYVKGPRINITEPTNGAEISNSYVTITGRVERATNLLINGSATNIDEKGNFSDNVVIFPGMNQITVTAQDQFGRSTKDQLTLVGNEHRPSVGNNISTSTTP